MSGDDGHRGLGRRDISARRRDLLKLGGMAAATAAVAAACGKPPAPDVQHTGNQAPSTTAGTAGPPKAPALPSTAADKQANVSMLQTMTSIELLAAHVYGKAIDSGMVTDAPAAAALKQFHSQHQSHATFLQRTTVDTGGKAYRKPNADLQENYTAPLIKRVHNGQDWLSFLAQVEKLGASSYVVATSSLTTADLRQAMMKLGGVSARRDVALRSLTDPNDPEGWAPDGLLPTIDAFPQTSQIGGTASG